MKSIVIGLSLLICFCHVNGQTTKAADQVIEGSKVVVELIKALSNKKELEKNPGCKGTYADLCMMNESPTTMTAILFHRLSNDKREIVIPPGMKECCLRISVGVWTYDLRTIATTPSLRKGDLLVEGCQNIMMNIKY